MSKEYIKKHVNEIMSNEAYPFPLNIAMSSVWIIGNFKGINLKVLDVKGKSSLTDYFILGSSTNQVQARAMANEVVSQLKRHNINLISQEGMVTAEWILLDFGDIIVHIFLENMRDIYSFDQLWVGADNIDIPHEYYSSAEEEGPQVANKSSDEDYY